jgi:hypothetical protein
MQTGNRLNVLKSSCGKATQPQRSLGCLRVLESNNVVYSGYLVKIGARIGDGRDMR